MEKWEEEFDIRFHEDFYTERGAAVKYDPDEHEAAIKDFIRTQREEAFMEGVETVINNRKAFRESLLSPATPPETEPKKHGGFIY